MIALPHVRKPIQPFSRNSTMPPRNPINRRDFVTAGAAAGISLALPGSTAESLAPTIEAPYVIIPPVANALVVSSSNGNRYKNGGTQTAVERAFAMMTGGTD